MVPILGLLQTPDAIKGNTVLYLRIMFGGVPIVMAYNLFAGMIRSLGDSKTPLYAMIVASCINISLDLLFVLVFHWGIAGAAVATLIAQVFAAGYCLWYLEEDSIWNMRWRRFPPGLVSGGTAFAVGLPMAFQNAIISVGGMIVQSVVNGFGMIFIAASLQPTSSTAFWRLRQPPMAMP
ncbi:MAG: polysaccharide biosynthesis C-terminal domain-containing protein [Oscillospiraceae bacterium]